MNKKLPKKRFWQIAMDKKDNKISKKQHATGLKSVK